MFLRILHNDLKRKKTMNIVVFLFITMATMFLASSLSNMVSIMGAVDYFMGISKVPDFFAVVVEEEGDTQIAEYLSENDLVTEYGKVESINIMRDDFYIIEEDGSLRNYEVGSTITVQPSRDGFLKLYDQEGELLQLEEGEIALPYVEADSRDLQIGDRLQITIGEVTQEFTLAVIMKDVAFGSKMIGFKRAAISEEDYLKFKQQDGVMYTNLHCVNSVDMKAFKLDMQKQNFSIISPIEKGTLKMAYVMDMLVAATLIIVSVCLILISFLVLRFTIVFTLQEDFKEIGIMKAIGIRDKGIKGVYLVKYLAMSVVAAIIGVIFSVPFGDLLLGNTLVNLVASDTQNQFYIHILSGVLIVVVVQWFCNTTANQLKKYSVIDAIRSGSNGERYVAKGRMKLWKMKKLKSNTFMACNDIVSTPKRFAVLILTYCVGIILIQLPMSALHTLTEEAMAPYFGMPQADVYIDNGKAEEYVAKKDKAVVEEDLKEIEQTLKEHGYTADVGTTLGYTVSCYADAEDERFNFYTIQNIGNISDYLIVLEGRRPVEDDEIMVTDVSAKKLGVTIGDTIYYAFGEEEKPFIVTGLYQSMLNLGEGACFSRKATPDSNYMAGVFSMYVEIEELDGDEAVLAMEEIFPDYVVEDIYEMMNSMSGGVSDILDKVVKLITMVVLIINSLITVLMMKAMMIKERGDIALLRSIGFTMGSIRGWLLKRIVMVLITAFAMGTVLSKALEPIVIVPIFGMMGADKIELVTRPFETFVLYPALLFVVTVLSAVWCTRDIKKIAPTEVNNIE